MNKKLIIAMYGKNAYMPVSQLMLPEYYRKKAVEGRAQDLLYNLIRENGVKKPLMINTYPGREGIIIDGSERYRLAKEFGIDELPIFSVFLTEEEERHFHYECSVRGREYSLAEIIEELRKPYHTYFEGIVNKESKIDDAVFKAAESAQEKAKEQTKGRQQSFPLRMGEYYVYLEKLKKLTGASSINEAIMQLIISTVEDYSETK